VLRVLGLAIAEMLIVAHFSSSGLRPGVLPPGLVNLRRQRQSWDSRYRRCLWR
jgi:hypothetical protein